MINLEVWYYIIWLGHSIKSQFILTHINKVMFILKVLKISITVFLLSLMKSIIMFLLYWILFFSNLDFFLLNVLFYYWGNIEGLSKSNWLILVHYKINVFYLTMVVVKINQLLITKIFPYSWSILQLYLDYYTKQFNTKT